jgi:response regulator receiver protein
MKLQIDEIPTIEETEIIIRCQKVDNKINRISNYLRTNYITIVGKLEGENYVLNLDDIYYFEAVENRVFAYVEKEVYEVNYKLQKLTELLERTSFIQTARTIVLNINKINRVSTLVNGRIGAVLVNGEKMIITRAYAHDFKRKLSE